MTSQLLARLLSYFSINTVESDKNHRTSKAIQPFAKDEMMKRLDEKLKSCLYSFYGRPESVAAHKAHSSRL